MAAPAKNEKDLASLLEDIATHKYIQVSDRAVLRCDVRSAQNTTLVIGAVAAPSDDRWVMSQPEVLCKKNII